MKNQSHYAAYQQALKEGVAISLKYLKVLFFGAPRTGKTSMRRRLVGEILNLSNEPVQASTGTAEAYDVIVKLVEDKITSSTTVVTKSKWSTVKALLGKENSTHETAALMRQTWMKNCGFSMRLFTELFSPVKRVRTFLIQSTTQKPRMKLPKCKVFLM